MKKVKHNFIASEIKNQRIRSLLLFFEVILKLYVYFEGKTNIIIIAQYTFRVI